MEYLQSITLGIIQGFTEFLPISSSAHLVIVPSLFHWQYQGLSFDIAMHLGTVVAIVAYFWRDWAKLISLALDNSETVTAEDYPRNFLWQILVATIPAGAVGYLIADIVESKLHSPYLLATNLIVFGLVLFLVDKYARKSLETKDIRYKQSFLVGLAQSLALIPGVSRSGITMVASRALGLSREKAARFSFLLGTPAMIGAFVFDLKKITAIHMDLAFVLGFFASLVSGLIAIRFLLAWLKKADFSIFFYYRILLGALVIGLAVVGWMK
ncbi:MAG: undecaprenyl-diphosphatase UppP [Candidatus Berkelbacteria bacterium]